MRAYTVLRDPELRREYDQGGIDAVRRYELKQLKENTPHAEASASYQRTKAGQIGLPPMVELFVGANLYHFYLALVDVVENGELELPPVSVPFWFKFARYFSYYDKTSVQ